MTNATVRRAAGRSLAVLALLAALLVFWELYRWAWTSAGWTWPFAVTDTSMPHIWTIAKAFGQPAQVNQPPLITVLLHKALFTAKEAAAGFALGAVIGFTLGVALVHSRTLQRGFLPYIVASQTIPILAIAPMVVVWVMVPPVRETTTRACWRDEARTLVAGWVDGGARSGPRETSLPG